MMINFQFSIFNFQLRILLLFLCLFLTGCEKDVSDQIKGKWQLKTVEEAGQLLSVDTVWYNFQSESLFMYQIYHPKADTFSWLYGYKTQPENTILHLELMNNSAIPKENILYFTDWKELTRTFTVDKINRKHLVLTGDNKTYTFNRY